MEYNTQTCVLERACRIKKLLFEYDYPLYIFFYNIRIPNNTQESKFSNQTMGGGKKQRAGKIHVCSNLFGDAGIKIIDTVYTCGTSCLTPTCTI